MGPRQRPRRHRDTERRRATARRGREDARGSGPRGLRRACVAVGRPHRAAHIRPAPRHRLLDRHGAHRLHPRRAAFRRRARGVRPSLRKGPRLPRPLHHQLVPPLSDGALRRGGRSGGDAGPPVAPPLPRAGALAGPRRSRGRRRHRAPAAPAGRPALHRRRDDPAGNHAWRHRRRRPSRRRALRGPHRRRRRAAARGPRHPDRRRRLRRSGVRHRRGQGHAGARSERLRDRTAPPPRPDRRPHAGRTHERRGAGGVPRPGPLRRARARGRAAGRARPAREGRGARTRRPALLPLRHGGRAASFRPVVRPHEAAGRAGARRLARRPRPLPPGTLHEGLRALAREHPRLVHLAAALVGPPHPRLVLSGRRLRVRHGRRARGAAPLPRLRRSARPGPGRPRHLVLFLALALHHARLA